MYQFEIQFSTKVRSHNYSHWYSILSYSFLVQQLTIFCFIRFHIDYFSFPVAFNFILQTLRMPTTNRHCTALCLSIFCYFFRFLFLYLPLSLCLCFMHIFSLGKYHITGVINKRPHSIWATTYETRE